MGSVVQYLERDPFERLSTTTTIQHQNKQQTNTSQLKNDPNRHENNTSHLKNDPNRHQNNTSQLKNDPSRHQNNSEFQNNISQHQNTTTIDGLSGSKGKDRKISRPSSAPPESML